MMNIVKCANMIKLFLTGLFLLTGLCFTVASNAADESQDTSTIVDSTHYRVSYKSKVEPLPLNRIHSWVVHVETLDGKPVEKAKVAIYGGMPIHKHGLPTEPAVTELGNGDYLVEGLKFSMNGWWQIWLRIRAGSDTDKVKFNIKF
jgi:hypothetical protein